MLCGSNIKTHLESCCVCLGSAARQGKRAAWQPSSILRAVAYRREVTCHLYIVKVINSVLTLI